MTNFRYRVIICVVAFLVAAMIGVFAYEPILHFLLRPLCNVDAVNHHRTSTTNSLLVINGGTCNLFVTSPLDGLSLRVKIAVFGGLVVASAGHPLAILEIRHTRPEEEREALCNPVHRGVDRALLRRSTSCILHLSACPQIPERRSVGRR